MKIKHSQSSINFSLMRILFIVFTVVGVAARTYQRFTQIEKETGFYKEVNFINIFVTVFIIIVPVIFIVLSFLSSETKALTYEKTKSKVLYAVSFATGLAFVFDAVSSFLKLSGAADNYTGAGFNELPFLKARVILAILSAVFMVMFAFKVKGSTDKVSKFFILPLAPAVWCAVRLFPLFANEISYIQVSDLFAEIFMLVFATMFFFYFASAVNGIGFFGCSDKLAAYGFAAAYLCGVINIPKLIATLVSAEKFIVTGYPLSAVDFMIFLFAFTAVYAADKSERNKEELLSEKE